VVLEELEQKTLLEEEQALMLWWLRLVAHRLQVLMAEESLGSGSDHLESAVQAPQCL